MPYQHVQVSGHDVVYEGKRQSWANALHIEFFHFTQFIKTAHQREYILAYPTPVMLCLEKLMIQAVKRTAARTFLMQRAIRTVKY